MPTADEVWSIWFDGRIGNGHAKVCWYLIAVAAIQIIKNSERERADRNDYERQFYSIHHGSDLAGAILTARSVINAHRISHSILTERNCMQSIHEPCRFGSISQICSRSACPGSGADISYSTSVPLQSGVQDRNAAD